MERDGTEATTCKNCTGTDHVCNVVSKALCMHATVCRDCLAGKPAHQGWSGALPREEDSRANKCRRCRVNT
eukprot:744431-Pyramimonas_sp.AAC.3